MNKALVKAQGISKKFAKDLRHSLIYGLVDIMRDVFGIKPSRRLRQNEFWALKNISFTVDRGDCLAILGANGAGKSTLLKIMNGLINADDGHLTMNGTTGAMIELGAGFNPLFTGHENIYLNGSILGFSTKEIDEKYDEIVAFSELEEFLDMPLLHYSSGMRVRLGFAIAIQMQPDILIIDEVLAVGDAAFRNKCFDALENIMKDTAVILVSHNVEQVHRLATKVMVLKEGSNMLLTDDIYEGISLYNSFAPDQAQIVVERGISVDHFTLFTERDQFDYPSVKFKDDLEFSMILTGKETFADFKIFINIFNDSYIRVANVSSPAYSIKKDGKLEVTGKIKELNVQPGKYFLTLNLLGRSVNSYQSLLARYKGIAHFIVEGKHSFTLALTILESEFKAIGND